MKQIPASLLTLIVGVLVTLISLWVGQNHHLMPEQASQQAPLVDNFFNVMVMIGTALFLLVQGAILFFVIKYRRPAGDDTDGLPIEGNFSLEIFWTAIPALIVLGLGVYSVEVYQQMGGFSPATSMMAHMHSSSQVAHHSMKGSAMAGPVGSGVEVAAAPSEPTYGLGATPIEKGKAPDLLVNVTGMQFAWLFEYPDQNLTTSELHIPLGADVQLNLAAQDVIHSFWVPQFRLKQDALPGEKTELRFVATKVGTYPIVCAELCGSYHGGMRSEVIVHTPEEFSQWLAENQEVAQSQSLNQAIALHTPRSTGDFLAPYAQEMGVTASALAQIAHP